MKRERVVLRERGVELALLDFGGQGPLALLHHANGFCGALWEGVATPLRERFRVVAFDARGHGDSSVPPWPEGYDWNQFPLDLLALVEHLLQARGLERVALGIGHSFGGTTTAVAAALRPDLFERVAMIDPVLTPPEWREGELPPELREAGSDHRVGMAEAARTRRHVWPSPEAVVDSWSKPGRPFSRWRPDLLQLYAREGFRRRPDGSIELKCSGEVEAAVYEAGGSLDAFPYAARIRCPVLIQRASESQFPLEVYERFAEPIPDARIETIEGSHLIVMERPDEVAASLLRFAGGEHSRPSAEPSSAQMRE
ncbi:MAG: alpha/beta fold hydrolase [Myxococcota bacterium]